MDAIYLICKCCHSGFWFTAGEQKFYKAKGLSEPKRCPQCRKAGKDIAFPRSVVIPKYTRRGHGYFRRLR